MGIKENLEEIKALLPEHVKLIAVSKTNPVEAILEAYHAGYSVFGENKVQELCSKYEVLPKDIEWHLIGHLQTNKVKYVAPFVSLIHSVDSLRLLSAINKEGLKNNRVIDCLLQFHIATEETKFGFDEEEARTMLSSIEYRELKNIRIRGVMGMATFTDDKERVRNEFRSLHAIFASLKSDIFKDDSEFKEISMGMSDDFLLAIEEGSTIVRVGTRIFGVRDYGMKG
ncbi:MAG: YggS family pyridoxal phosphate-dependent enzyme [Bacteroidota bacterium]|nr:YggS family pyridoxal phosphate-dependent enzyme [Bacteroidota bacterium]